MLLSVAKLLCVRKSTISLHLNILEVGALQLVFGDRNSSTLGIVPELLILILELGHDCAVCHSDWLDLEESVHCLEWDRLGLGDQEVDKRNGEDHEASEEKVDSVSHGKEHLWCESADNEVPEPVVRSCGSLAQRSHVLVEHLRVDDPWGTIPRGSIECSPQVEEEYGRDAAGCQLRIWFCATLDTRDLDICTDEPHAHRAANSTTH
jgi:hypothetical protein